MDNTSEHNTLMYEPTELSAYLDGELTAGQRRRVEARMVSEPAYARELAQLERTRAMLTLCMDTPTFHDRLMTHVRREQLRSPRSIRSYWVTAMTAVSAAAIAVACTYVLVNRPPSLQKPELTAAATSEQKSPDSAEPAVISETIPSPAAAAATQSGSPETQAFVSLPVIELIGTVTGGSPSAILSTDDGRGGRTTTVQQGQELEPGIRLMEVSSSNVILDAHGQSIEIGLRAADTVNYADKLNGVWEVHEKPDTSALREPPYLEVRRNGGTLAVKRVDREDVIQATFRLMARRLSIHIPEYQDTRLTGEISEDGDSISLEVVLDDEDIGRGVEPTRVQLSRVRQEDNSEELDRQMLRNQCASELKEMYAMLRDYSEGHEGLFPPALTALEPGDASDLSLFESSSERRVEYFPDALPPSPEALPPGPPYEPAHTYPDRLLAWEDALRSSGAVENLWPRIVLRLSYLAEDIVGTVNARGVICVQSQTEFVTLDAVTMRQQVAQLRSQDQNNLKQLGLVIKMFANEHHGFTPPGWLSVYPEYLSDTQILTSPKDKAGTESYEYLLPAVNLDAMVQELVEEPDNPSAVAQTQSEIPLVMNKSDWPDGCRNMLFADGHVEYVRDWRERILPK